MKKGLFISLLFILTFFILSSISIAENEWLFSTQSLDLELNISSKVTLHKESSQSEIEYLNVNMTLFPRSNTRQIVFYIETEPKSQTSKDSINFQFIEPEKEELNFKMSSHIRTFNNFSKIKKKIIFPIIAEDNLIKDNIIEYVKPTKNIDSDNEDIIRLASQIAQGENDMYFVVFKEAEWIKKNIKYSLSTLTADVSQKASWVLENREGVCDEISTLFIAMLRSLGIPARYMSGLAYTNFKFFKEGFGPHGWVDVYFPGYGWVPYDITYDQYGYVDATHIILKESFDSDESSTEYQWKENKVEVDTSRLNFDVGILANGKQVLPLTQIELNFLKDNVGFGSYNLVESTVKNPNDYYVIANFAISKSDGLENIDSEKKGIILKPKEIKKLYWIVKVDENLDLNYDYTFQVGIYDEWNSSVLAQFRANKGGSFFNYDDILSVVSQKKEEETKVYSEKVEIICEPSSNRIYLGENIKIYCSIRNTGNVYLENISMCTTECKTLNLGISRIVQVEFNDSSDMIGQRDVFISVNSTKISKLVSVSYDVFDRPNIEVDFLKFPEFVDYGNKYTIDFELNRTSKSIPKNLRIIFTNKDEKKNWELPELDKKREFVINLFSQNLGMENEFTLIVEYSDDIGREYSTEKHFVIKLNEMDLFTKIKFYSYDLGLYVSKLNPISLMVFFLTFGIVAGLILKKRKN